MSIIAWIKKIKKFIEREKRLDSLSKFYDQLIDERDKRLNSEMDKK